VLEIKNPTISKGAAAQRWLKRNYAFVLSIGDDVTDEELFSTLPVTAYSIRVGRGRTNARFRVKSYRNVIGLLKKLAK
jgi:trehalose 6-phosphate synthase/phosphatase